MCKGLQCWPVFLNKLLWIRDEARAAQVRMVGVDSMQQCGTFFDREMIVHPVRFSAG